MAYGLYVEASPQFLTKSLARTLFFVRGSARPEAVSVYCEGRSQCLTENSYQDAFFTPGIWPL